MAAFSRVVPVRLLAATIAFTLFRCVGVAGSVQPRYASPEYSTRFTSSVPAPALTPGKVFHVSITKGTNKGDGSAERPFQVLAAARAAIRTIKRNGVLPDGGVEVRIHSGYYRVEATLELSAEDSGTANAPIVWRGVNRDRVVLSGGTPLNPTLFTPVPASVTQERLHPDARGNVVRMDLSSIDVEAVFGGKGEYGQLSMNGHLLQLARWPNRGYHQIGEFVDRGPTTRWLKPGEKPMPYSEDNPTGGRFTFRPGCTSGCCGRVPENQGHEGTGLPA